MAKALYLLALTIVATYFLLSEHSFALLQLEVIDGVYVRHLIFGFYWGSLLAFVIGNPIPSQDQIRRALIPFFVAVCCLLFGRVVISLESNSLMHRELRSEARDLVTNFSSILLLVYPVLFLTRHAGERLINLFGETVRSDDSGNLNADADPDAVRPARISWSRVLIPLMLFSVVFQSAVNHWLTVEVIRTEEVMTMLTTLGGKLFVTFLAVAVPTVFIEKQTSSRGRFWVSFLYFAWLTFLLVTTAFANRFDQLLPLIYLCAGFSIGFILIVNWCSQTDHDQPLSFNLSAAGMGVVLVGILFIAYLFDPIAFAETGDLKSSFRFQQ